MESLYQLLDSKEQVSIKLKRDLADTQEHIEAGVGYLESHFAEEPPKSDPKYEAWEEIALRYLNRYHELVEKEKELLAKI